jgi:hypothetical protein
MVYSIFYPGNRSAHPWALLCRAFSPGRSRFRITERHCVQRCERLSFQTETAHGDIIQPSNHPTIQPSNHPTIYSSSHQIIGGPEDAVGTGGADFHFLAGDLMEEKRGAVGVDEFAFFIHA